MDMQALYTPLLWACAIAFLTSAPLALALRARQPRQTPWWLVIVLAAALGWMTSHVYACLETRLIEAEREDAFRHGMLADYFGFVPPPFTLYWGWTFGLGYLVACLPLYRLLRENMNSRPFRPFVALTTTLAALAGFSVLPPWGHFELNLPFEFAALYAAFLFCAGVSHHALRFLRLQAAWWPFVVMFLINFLLRQVHWALRAMGVTVGPDEPLEIQEPAEWAALFGALFTALWWIAIRGADRANSNQTGAPLSASTHAARLRLRLLCGALLLATALMVVRIPLVPETPVEVPPAGHVEFGTSAVARVGLPPSYTGTGPERLRGRIMLDGAGLEGPQLSLTLNGEYEVEHVHPDSHGIFEIPLPAGKWHVNEIFVSDWDGRPKDRNLILFSNYEPTKNGGQYSRFNFHLADGLEVSLPPTSSAIPVEIEFRDALSMTWPPLKGRGAIPDAELSTAAITWQPVKGADEYEVQIGHVQEEGNSRFPLPLSRFPLPILTRRVAGLSLPLASLPQRSPGTGADEYTVHVFAFDAQGRLLTENSLEPDDRMFKLTGATRLGRERQYVGFAGPPEVISAEYEANGQRLEMATHLLDQKRLDEARRVLDQVTKDAEHGRAAALRGKCAPAEDRKLCERTTPSP